MDLRALATFVAVVDLASFSEAARRLGYTQSAVSQQVATLERDLGASLLHRRPVVPTPAGAQLLGRARDLLARSEAARAQVRRAAADPTDATPLRLALSPGAERSGLRLPRHLAAVLTRPTPEAVALLAAGEVDVAVVDGVTAPSDPLPVDQPPGVIVRVLAEGPVHVLLPRDHPLARRAGLDLAALAGARWVDAPRAELPLADLEAAGRTTLRRSTSYDGQAPATLHALVGSGAGLAATTSADAPDGLVAVPVIIPRLAHRVELWHHDVDRDAVRSAAAKVTII